MELSQGKLCPRTRRSILSSSKVWRPFKIFLLSINLVDDRFWGKRWSLAKATSLRVSAFLSFWNKKKRNKEEESVQTEFGANLLHFCLIQFTGTLTFILNGKCRPFLMILARNSWFLLIETNFFHDCFFFVRLWRVFDFIIVLFPRFFFFFLGLC